MRKFLFTIAALFCLSSPAWAINCAVANGTCFWIGGTGTMDFATDSAHWSNTTGGATCSCEPISSNILTFDGSSGAGTVTIGATVNVSQINMSSSSVSLVNSSNFAVTLSNTNGFICTAGSASGLTMGSSVWKFTGSSGIAWNVTGTCLTGGTLTSTGSTIELASSAANGLTQFRGNGLTYNNLQLDAYASGVYSFNATNATFSNLSINCPATLVLSPITMTVSTISQSGCASGSYFSLLASQPPCTTCILTLSSPATISFAGISQIKVQTSTLTANSSYDLGGNTGTITINPPATGTGGGGFIIGGG